MAMVAGSTARGGRAARTSLLRSTTCRVSPDELAGLWGFRGKKGEGREAAALVYNALLLLPLSDAAGVLHFADAALPNTFVVDERATELGNPAMDGGCLAAMAASLGLMHR